MAEVKVLLQGLVKNHDHENALMGLLNDDTPDCYLLSVAFARTSGIKLISSRLQVIQDRVQFYIGIANGVTSIQAIQSLLDVGISPYVIDMGSNRRIYHPKIYATFSGDIVNLILGSANMTYTGLNENVEASTIMMLDRNDGSDATYISVLENKLLNLHNLYPDHVTQVTDTATLEVLLDEGRLEDETVKSRASVTGHAKNKNNARALKPFPVITRRKRKPKPPVVNFHAGQAPQGIVWRSRELTERDLSIPTGPNTNATGSMYFKKGLMDDIDQRHYFRDEVFSILNWQPDPSPAKNHLERAEANFELIIDGISTGYHRLKLTHNTLTNTKTYAQKNAMTQIHWGAIRSIVGDRGLLGKFITLYHLGNDNFQIDIN